MNVKDENPYAEWYWNSLTKGMKAKRSTGNGALTWEFHKRVYGANFPYSDFAPMFRAEMFDPDQWADVFARSGAQICGAHLETSRGLHACGAARRPTAPGAGRGTPWTSARSATAAAT